MKLRRESAENGDFSGPKGEFKKLFSGRNRIEIPSGRKIVFWTEKAPLSAFAVAGFMKYAGQPTQRSRVCQCAFVFRAHLLE